jgi:hypothetical protein
MQMHLFIFVETVEYLFCFLLYRADIVCSQYKAESVEPRTISLFFPGSDKNRQYAPERIRIFDRNDINQEPVTDVDFHAQYNTAEGNMGLTIDGRKDFFGTVTAEGSLYKGYNVLCIDHRTIISNCCMQVIKREKGYCCRSYSYRSDVVEGSPERSYRLNLSAFILFFLASLCFRFSLTDGFSKKLLCLISLNSPSF